MSNAPATGPAPARTPAAASNRNLYAVVLAVIIPLVLGSLDNLILGVAMPRIVGEFGGIAHLSWVIAAYALTTSVSTPVWGKLGDLYGRKGAFLTAIAIFLVGSALSGLSQSMSSLIAFRALQGIGGGGLMVGTLAIISTVVPLRDRGRYQGLISAVIGGAMIAGPVVGGLITDHLGWRWCFYVNLPLGVLALVMVSTLVHLPGTTSRARIDYPGVALMTVAISAVVLVTSWGGSQYAWTSGVILVLVGLAIAALLLFLFVERRAAEPVLPPSLFRNANFSLATGIGFLLGFMMFAVMTFLPIFQQAAQGASPTSAGLRLLPVFAALMAANVVVGRLITKTGRYKPFMVAGGALMAVGLFLVGRQEPDTAELFSVVAMALVGLGMGCLTQTSIIITMQSVDRKDLGVASSTATLSRTIGGSIGVSVMGAIFTAQVDATMAERAGSAATAFGGSVRLDPDKLASMPDIVRRAYEFAVADGNQMVFQLAAALGVVAFAAALFVKEVPLRRAAPAPSDDPAEGEPDDTETGPATAPAADHD